jgi:prepilin-type N-terminal cleavage/methylation domain-containing protein
MELMTWKGVKSEMNRKNYFSKGFTLIELLVVVGILAILAIAALIAINPLESQRRSRDSARLQDMARLSASVEAFYNDNGIGDATVGTLPASKQSKLEGSNIRSQGCGIGGSWLDVDVCAYLKQVPLDPQNARLISAVTTPTGTTRSDVTASYGFVFSNGNYEFCTYLEADKNRQLLNDGGNGAAFFETGTQLALNCTP